MSRLRQLDILVEMIELCRDRMNEVRQQLVYYRASVYKGETAGQISIKIDQLRTIGNLFGDVLVQESFTDYDAMAKAGVMHYIPGECGFSTRVTQLLASLDHNLIRLGKPVGNPEGSQSDEVDFTNSIRAARQQLIALCAHGSHQWSFFHRL